MTKEYKVCFLGGARYSCPLNTTSAKKFQVLGQLGKMFVVGFAQDWMPRKFTKSASFYLLPQLPWSVLRYVEMFTLGPLLVIWCILRHDVRILVTQSPYEGFAAVCAKKIASLAGRKVALIVESHSDYEGTVFLDRRILFPKFYRFIMRNMARFALQNADILRAISASTRQRLEKQAPGKPIYEFAAWTDIDPFIQVGSDKIKQPSQDILFAGVLTPLKGIHHLVNAFAEVAQDFPESRLFIVGAEVNKAYSAKLKAQVNLASLSRRIQFVGAVPQPELATRMHEAAVLVLPSLSEGLGRVVIEAMATGTLVIGTKVGGIPELIEDGLTGFLVASGDEKALANRLRWTLKHSEDAHEMGHRARAFAEHYFSTESYIQGYASLFEEAEKIIQKTKARNAKGLVR